MVLTIYNQCPKLDFSRFGVSTLWYLCSYFHVKCHTTKLVYLKWKGAGSETICSPMPQEWISSCQDAEQAVDKDWTPLAICSSTLLQSPLFCFCCFRFEALKQWGAWHIQFYARVLRPMCVRSCGNQLSSPRRSELQNMSCHSGSCNHADSAAIPIRRMLRDMIGLIYIGDLRKVSNRIESTNIRIWICIYIYIYMFWGVEERRR